MPKLSSSLEIALLVASVAFFVGSIAAIPFIVVRLPADHFVQPPRPRGALARTARNFVGAGFVMLGILLLVLPGQGILTILVGLSVLDLPFKRRLVRSLLHFPRVRAALQALRRSAGRAPLILPPARPRDAMARLRRKRSARNTGGDHRTL